MAFTTQDHYDANCYPDLFSASSFEKALLHLLAVADYENTRIIECYWGHKIERMAQMYRQRANSIEEQADA